MKTQPLQSALWTLFFCLISIVGYADEDNVFVRLDQDIFDAIYDEPPQSEPLGTTMEIGYLSWRWQDDARGFSPPDGLWK